MVSISCNMFEGVNLYANISEYKAGP
jgi:hypothetical protein